MNQRFRRVFSRSTPTHGSTGRDGARRALLLCGLVVGLWACGGESDADTTSTDTSSTDATSTDAIGTDAIATDADAADASAPATSGSFTALTYNVKGLPDVITGWDTADHMKQISPKLNPFELVGIQEDFIEGNHKLLMAEATHPQKDWFSAKKDEKTPYGAGVNLLSRMAVTKKLHTPYNLCLGIIDHASDCLANKGVLFNRVQLSDHPDASVDVYVTHMEAGGSKEEDKIRLDQINIILQLMETHSKGRAVIVMGDFNLRLNDPPDVPAIEKLNKDGGLTDSCAALSCPEPNHIDRFHFRSGDKLKLTVKTWTRELAFVDAEGEDLSDHPAISTRFDWQMK